MALYEIPGVIIGPIADGPEGCMTCCFSMVLAGVLIDFSCGTHIIRPNPSVEQPAQQVAPEIRQEYTEKPQNIIDPDRMGNYSHRRGLSLENVTDSDADIKRPQRLEENIETFPVGFKSEWDDDRRVKEPEGLKRKVYNRQNELEKPIKRGNPRDVVAEDFVVGREEYLRKYLGTSFLDSKKDNGRIGEEAIFYVNKYEMKWEAKRFYSKSEKRYLKILCFADAGSKLGVHLEDKNWYYSSDLGETWKPNERTEDSDVDESTSFLLKQIENYQQNISPRIKQRIGVEKICRFNPSCSEYAKQAIEKYGAFRGAVLAAGRLCRCNPWSKGGEDPVA